MTFSLTITRKLYIMQPTARADAPCVSAYATESFFLCLSNCFAREQQHINILYSMLANCPAGASATNSHYQSCLCALIVVAADELAWCVGQSLVFLRVSRLRLGRGYF